LAILVQLTDLTSLVDQPFHKHETKSWV
jgi:hypothetical protein